MNGSVWLGWVVVVLFGIVSITLLMGKGRFLIAGYNTSSKQEKQKYNEKRLCHVMGSGLGSITILAAIFTFYEGELPSNMQWLMPWGILVVLAILLILGNTICKNKSVN